MQSSPSLSPDYNFVELEPRWQRLWHEQKAHRAITGDPRPKYYILDMFPYPSGAGLHIGHPEGYTATDILARYKRARGFNVLHPIGWDAFGLPAEQHAAKTGAHPATNTAANIVNFRRQINALGFSYDWDREVNTTDPGYFKWTQWIFLQLFRRGLAYVDERPVWWCPELKTVLANEEVIDGRSEVGGYPVERRNLRQWVLRITAYAERLLADLKDLDWPDSTKRMQEAWIGRSEGSEVEFDIADLPGERLRIFTTRVDTIFGATYMVIAPEHTLVPRLTTPAQRVAVDTYVKAAASKSDLERTELAKEKTGVFTGAYAINPATEQRIPIWIADYVLASYGTGAIMAVPAHDERDFEFATKFELPIPPVIEPDASWMPWDQAPAEVRAASGAGADIQWLRVAGGRVAATWNGKLPFCECGRMINSGEFSGLSSDEGKAKLDAHFAGQGRGKGAVQFKLRDWLFSRQRYWGEPFPIVWVSETDYQAAVAAHGRCLPVPTDPVTAVINGQTFFALPLPEAALPLRLPEVTSYLPTGTGESPLAAIADWIDVWHNPATGQAVPASAPRPTEGQWMRARRESNTMPQWAGSCWYYLRYLDPRNDATIASLEALRYWGMPDLYVGGAEHAVLHLLYARFWHKALYDIGAVPMPEPFQKLFHQGIILGEIEYNLILDGNGQPRSAKSEDARNVDALPRRRLNDQEVVKVGADWFWKEDQAIRVDAQSFKMSKSRGNVVSPDSVIAEYGADTLRLYLMFLGPLEASKPWNPRGIEGVHRFLRGVWREVVGENGRLAAKIVAGSEPDAETERLLHATIKKVTEDIEGLRFNTAISQMMILRNQIQKAAKVSRGTLEIFLQLLQPFAPHLAYELWERLHAPVAGGVEPGSRPATSRDVPPAPLVQWPVADASKLVSDTVKIIVQVNGKYRGEIVIAKSAGETEARAAALALRKVQEFIAGQVIRKVVFVPGRILNIVTGGT